MDLYRPISFFGWSRQPYPEILSAGLKSSGFGEVVVILQTEKYPQLQSSRPSMEENIVYTGAHVFKDQ